MRCIVLRERRYRVDVQLKRGLLDVCVLAAIKDEDSYGYQIIKDISPFVTVSESTLYPNSVAVTEGVLTLQFS